MDSLLRLDLAKRIRRESVDYIESSSNGCTKTGNSLMPTVSTPLKPGKRYAFIYITMIYLKDKPFGRWALLISILLVQLPIIIDMTILHVAVPTLTIALEATGTEVLWIIDVYPLSLACLLFSMGALADRIGVRRMFLSGAQVFLFGSLIAAYAPSASILILARALMGIGAAMVMPCVLAIIRNTFANNRERALALGLWSAVSSAGAALGPLVGGLLIENFWWGAVFLINVIFILVTWPAGFFLLPKDNYLMKSQYNIGQSLLLITGLLTFISGLKLILKFNEDFAFSVVMLVIGALLIVFFVRVQIKVKKPIMDLSLLSKPAIRVGLLAAFVVAGAFVGIELTIALELQYVIGLTPLQSGIFMMPLMIAAAIGGPMASLIISKIGLRALVTSAFIFSGISIGAIALSDFHEPGIHVFLLLILLGLALSIGLTSSSIAVMGSSPPGKAAACGALEMTGYKLGAAFGIAIVGIVLESIYRKNIELPPGISKELGSKAVNSISDTMIVASNIGGLLGENLVQAGRKAFVNSHIFMLAGSSAVMIILAIVVFYLLRGFRDRDIDG